MAALLPGHRTDDAALLLARTHALTPERVADWNVEPDVSQVPPARQFAVERLATCAGPAPLTRADAGLMLVAQLTQGWGTRHSTNGKTIWGAQNLDSP